MSGNTLRGGTVLIAGGGTGGHVYPALAIGAELAARGAAPVFVGTARGLEARLVPQHGMPLELVRVRGIHGRGLRGAASLLALPLAAWDALCIVRRHRPRAVVGVGGYASGPVVAVAALMRYPTLIEEQNAAPGATNRLLSWLARDIALPSEEARPAFRGRGFVSGVPVRQAFLQQKKKPAAAARYACSSSAGARGPMC